MAKLAENRKKTAVAEKREEFHGAGLGRRFLAYLADWYLGALATALPVSVVSMKLYGTVQNQNIMSFYPPYGLIAGCLGLFAAVIYYVAVPVLLWRGQTPGKHWLKIKIVNEDGSEAGTGRLILRQLLGIIIVEGSLVSASTIWHQMVSIITGVNVVSILMYAGMAVSLVSSILVLAGRHRAVHDWIGGTVVVSCK
ncbi:MAG TPA: RDD family protein [Candidatus Lachnoclostridium stercorigallinarum]|uniref:RDD family protein n=1 Tax=Candidatus Lachnoclostridium stercorigallinarum TaxID=2838634 RepID=A0A9D2GH30_9FIRM|nr:RDD family protein [Candidatus Lachnoclostridium stercorigallinarum]